MRCVRLRRAALVNLRRRNNKIHRKSEGVTRDDADTHPVTMVSSSRSGGDVVPAQSMRAEYRTSACRCDQTVFSVSLARTSFYRVVVTPCLTEMEKSAVVIGRRWPVVPMSSSPILAVPVRAHYSGVSALVRLACGWTGDRTHPAATMRRNAVCGRAAQSTLFSTGKSIRQLLAANR